MVVIGLRHDFFRPLRSDIASKIYQVPLVRMRIRSSHVALAIACEKTEQFLRRGMRGAPSGKTNEEKLPRLAKAFFVRVAESSRDFFFFLSRACMKCPLQRRHHERYSENLAMKVG